MRERPILFSEPMVRAILAGTKTQTRRAIKPQPYVDNCGNACWNGYIYGQDAMGLPLFKSLASPIPSSRTKRVLCPYGRPGDRLWVRETWQAFFADEVAADRPRGPRHTLGIPAYPNKHSFVYYRADGEIPEAFWRPSIHLARRYSRITLEITGVRVERLQDISEADAISEGVANQTVLLGHSKDPGCVWGPADPVAEYCNLWDSINGAGSWDANPWVWVVEFKRAVIAKAQGK